MSLRLHASSHSRLQFVRSIKALGPVLRMGGFGAEDLLGVSLTQWCRADFPGLPQPKLPRPRKLAQAPQVLQFVQMLREVDFLEASFWLSSAYAMLSTPERRRGLAMFFTPPPITRGLLDDLERADVDFTKCKFCDPACGGAAFLAAIAQRIRLRLREQGSTPLAILRHVESHLVGLDLDRVLCRLASHFLLMVLSEEVLAAGYILRPAIELADSLSEAKAYLGRLDVVVCNPPYRKLSAEEVEAYRPAFGDVIEAQSNLYALFIALSLKLLRSEGLCALVTPTSFMSGRHFARLRTFLLREATLEHIGMVSDRIGVFVDVEQETALTLVRRRRPKSDAQPPKTSVSVVSRSGTYDSVGECALPIGGAVWPIPRAENDVALIERALASRHRLADYGYAARIGGFVWNRDERATFATEAHAKSGSATRRRPLGTKGATRGALGRATKVVPLLWSSDIRKARLDFDGQAKVNHEDRFVTAEHPSVVRRPSVLLQRVTSNDQPMRLVAAAVPARLLAEYGGFVGENHTVVLEQVDPHADFSPTEMAQLLVSPSLDRYFRCISGSTNVSIFELKQLPLPAPARLRAMLAAGLPMALAVERALAPTTTERTSSVAFHNS
jgi:adenine-specific DNA-methyltransferase